MEEYKEFDTKTTLVTQRDLLMLSESVLQAVERLTIISRAMLEADKMTPASLRSLQIINKELAFLSQWIRIKADSMGFEIGK